MTDNDDKPPVQRDPVTGQYPKGVSGNPAGRVKGTKNRITLARLMLEEALRDSLTKAGPKLMRKAISMALKGDDKVMRALLDKMLATPRGDDETGAGDRDIRIVLQNFTGPQGQLPAIDGTVVRHQIKGQSTVSKESNQSPEDNIPTVTSKSSGLQYVSASPEPAQEKSVQKREDSTTND